MTITTAEAATQADVTVATIRTWCRRDVIAAVKQAGRWVIDTASLARRIAIGAMRVRKQATLMIDLDATYTITLIADQGPVTITPKVKRRTVRRTGQDIITVTGIVPLLADRIDTITDPGNRAHAVTVLQSASIVIADTYDADWDREAGARHGGQLRTTYRGEIPQVTIDHVLDLAEQLRTQLSS
ncbi:helix-turn-helix domain-containing protein [Streptomyces sp. NPDC051644]|uniref:helix-turn-helix domain-containing protein n=1 Tax=Streptomyces sp. NPDC051644 TaxID=3365666 RepID=UPI00378E19D1